MQSGRFIFFLRQQNDCGFVIEETDTGLFQQRGVVRHVVGIRRAALREAYLKKFREANQGNPAYAEDPDKFITGNFRPVHDYIRQITGLTASNSTIKRCLMDLVPEESRPEEKKTVRPVTATDVQRRAEALAGTITLYRTDDPDLMLAMQDTLDMTERLIEQLGKEAK